MAVKSRRSVINLAITLAVSILGLSRAQFAFPNIPCQDEPDNLSVGHEWLTDENYRKFKTANQKLFVLGVSDSSCARCCQSESMLSQLKEDFDNKVYTGKKGAKLKIGRVDLAAGHEWVISEGVSQRFNAGDLPAILVMHEGTYYKYPPDAVVDEDHNDVSCLLHFINRLQHPL